MKKKTTYRHSKKKRREKKHREMWISTALTITRLPRIARCKGRCAMHSLYTQAHCTSIIYWMGKQERLFTERRKIETQSPGGRFGALGKWVGFFMGNCPLIKLLVRTKAIESKQQWKASYVVKLIQCSAFRKTVAR